MNCRFFYVRTWLFLYVHVHTGVGHTDSASAQHFCFEKLSPIFFLSLSFTIINHTIDAYLSVYRIIYNIYIYIFFIHCIIPFWKFGPPYLGKTTAAVRAALPSPISACWVFLCFRNIVNIEVVKIKLNKCHLIVPVSVARADCFDFIGKGQFWFQWQGPIIFISVAKGLLFQFQWSGI